MRKPDPQRRNRESCWNFDNAPQPKCAPSLEAAILRALDTQELEIQPEGLAAQIDAATKHMDALIAQNSRIVQDQDQYERDFTQARQRHEELLQQHVALLEQIQSKNDRQAAYHYYKQELEQLDAQTLEFSPYLCVTLLDSIDVVSDGILKILLKNQWMESRTRST